MDSVPDDIPLPLAEPPPSWLAHLRACTNGCLRDLEAGQVLLREGERPPCFWALQSGAVALASTTPSGRRATVAILGRGAVLGEPRMSPNASLSHSDLVSLPEARALIASTVCSVPFPALRVAMASDPRLAWWVVVAMSRRASQIQRTLARTLALPVPLRLLGVLEDLAAEHGSPGPAGVGVEVPLTQDLLASMVGVTRESVNRAIGDLEREGLVRRAGLRYVLSRPSVVSEDGRM